LIENIIFTGEEIRKVVERSGLPNEIQMHIWASFVDYAHIDKRLNTNSDEDSGDEHPNLFV
jgi:hypothetical protein